MKIFAPHALDFYKADHAPQYPKNTTMVYSNETPRSASRASHVRLEMDGHETVLFAGLTGWIKWFLIDCWNESFFSQPKEKVLAKYKRRMDNALGPGAVSIDRLAALHDLGFMPLHIKALPEGSLVPMRVPMFTLRNTHEKHPDFFWLTNYIESVMSADTWKTITNATTAHQYATVLRKYAELTGTHPDFCAWQGHDFSFRGLSGVHDAAQSGFGHLLSFYGTDTVPAIDYAEDYYNADSDKEMVGGSVPASEHSVMCAGGDTGEVETIRRLISEIYPSGIVSVVSDTWDFWNVITKTALELKDVILNRPVNALGMAKVVFRPDSGDPVKILTGYTPDEYHAYNGPTSSNKAFTCKVTGKLLSSLEIKGAVECLWDIFGGTTTDKGFKQLNERVGLIYGDSITISRANEILQRLMSKGFASGNVVFGIGSYTYQHITRDTYGMAVKATAVIVDGELRELFKDPKTDDGMKKSAKGLLRVEREGDTFVLYDQQTWEQEASGALETVFLDGKLVKDQSLAEIRARVGFIK